MDSSLQSVSTEMAPTPLGPYSQGVVDNSARIVYVAGYVGQDPRTRELVDGGIGPQTERTLANIAGVLSAARSDVPLVLSVDVSLANLGRDLEAFNEAYKDWFRKCGGTILPARTMRGAQELTLGALVEVSCIARLREEQA